MFSNKDKPNEPGIGQSSRRESQLLQHCENGGSRQNEEINAFKNAVLSPNSEEKSNDKSRIIPPAPNSRKRNRFQVEQESTDEKPKETSSKADSTEDSPMTEDDSDCAIIWEILHKVPFHIHNDATIDCAIVGAVLYNGPIISRNNIGKAQLSKINESSTDGVKADTVPLVVEQKPEEHSKCPSENIKVESTNPDDNHSDIGNAFQMQK